MEMASSTDTPIACTLEAGDFKERLAWIAKLNQAALLDARRDGAQLVLTYRPDHADDVREMVRREEQCCAFLGFDLKQNGDRVVLVIEAPQSATDTLDAIFQPFLTGTSPSAGCGCSETSSRQGESHGR
jgi:hypothetical protein